MRKSAAATGSSVFMALAPGTVAGLVPWWLTRWQSGHWWLPVRVLGGVALAAGAVVLVHTFVRFVTEGLGTPAPVAPTEHLVVGGLYRHVRNPMYVAVVTAIAGQGLLLARPVLLVYAVVAGAVMAAFARWYEEPALLRAHGAEYERYRRAVPGWLPRPRPWRG
ncbi:methyltransferase family protein [Streptomyces sp. NRRL B-1347]|uniref:methyltransferase family protein n=1 Tax=Streptomyces sp. NRRL B-1347 TaxID=1476877 RepID=UPI0004C67CCF|nr:isoprenylcysteine carboxylmethyltransferase family protein [Streptomyces sp. NRRL B-1347]